MACQLFVDLYGCDAKVLNDAKLISKIAKESVERIGAQIVEECIHQFEPIGISYIAVITTSHFSIHTWPENGYAAVDVFSCNEEIPMELSEILKAAFGAKNMKMQNIVRNIIEEE